MREGEERRMTAERPNLDEVVLGAFLHDIGKFMQRAHDWDALPPEVRNRAEDVLPSFRSNLSHWHALWSDAFLEMLEREGVSFPAGINLNQVREVAIFHHKPSTPVHWLCTEADRLSSGMDRKEKDEKTEAEEAAPLSGRNAFRQVALESIFARIELRDLGSRPHLKANRYRAGPLRPEALLPEEREAVEGPAQEQAYRAAWEGFFADFTALCRGAPNMALFHEGVISVGERWLWAIPSSTIDQPDVSLFDHSRSVAAIAACLYKFHEEKGGLDDERAIRDRARPKFRFLVGDLSGIQSTLFRLAAQQVKGGSRILRGRSFLIGAILEAAALLLCQRLGLPPFALLQTAGGRFLMLVPNLAKIEDQLAELRRSVDEWLLRRYFGDLALNLVLGPAFGGEGLLSGKLPYTRAALEQAVAEAKQRPFSGLARAGTGRLVFSDYPDRPDGACPSCGVRPATQEADGVRRCEACHDEYRAGRRLPAMKAALWRRREHAGASGARGYAAGGGASTAEKPLEIAMPGDLVLELHTEVPPATPQTAWREVISGWRVLEEDAADGKEAPRGSATGRDAPELAHRPVAHHVPRLRAEDLRGKDARGSRYAALSEEARQVEAGDIKTFEHLGQDALEEVEGRLLGTPHLAVLKADVDRLGQIFSQGLGSSWSLGRVAALSRMLDAFFTIWLPDLLKRKFPDTYTVYAGGDDLLLVGPWRQMIELVQEIGNGFAAYVAHNPHITLSAGLELAFVDEPLNRAVRRAEERLETAKDAGKRENTGGMISLITATPLTRPQLAQALEDAERVSGWLRERDREALSTAFVHRALMVARDAHSPAPPLNWKARWAYILARHFSAKTEKGRERLKFFDRLLESGLERDAVLFPQAGHAAAAPAEIVLTIALYRNR